MKQIGKETKCKECIRMQPPLKYQNLNGVYRCKNYIKKERAKDEQIQKQESTN